MAYIKDDPQFEEVIKILKGLPHIDASQGFEMNLRRILHSENYRESKPWFYRALSPSRLIPSAALAAAAIMMFFFFNIEAPQFDDPLSVEPQLREDVYTDSQAGQFMLEKLQRSINTDLRASSNVSFIAKSGLNFRQVNLSDAEKIKLQRLKEKFKNWFRTEK